MARGVKVDEAGRPAIRTYGDGTCVECAQTFVLTTPTQIRCSRACKMAYNRRYSAERHHAGTASKQSPEQRLNAYLRRAYGITLVEYEAMLAAQGGACHVCRRLPEGGRRLAVDHDHACCPGERSCGLCVRALLCIRCNAALGMVQDDPAVIRALLDYVEAVRE